MIWPLLAALSFSVDSVVVYPNGATVYKSAKLRLTTDTLITVEGLPGDLDENSLRIRADEGVSIVELSVERGYAKEPSPRVRALEGEIRTLEDSLAALNDRLDVLASSEKYLESVRVAGPDLTMRDLLLGQNNPAAWKSGLSFLEAELARVRSQKRQVNRLIKALSDTLEAKRAQLRDVREWEARRVKLTARLRVTRAGTHKILIKYNVASAGWKTSYELSALPGESKALLRFYALVWQRTGEDWPNTRIVLSTSTPRPQRTPELLAWDLDFVEERPAYGAAPKAAPRLLGAAPAELEAEAPPPVSETGISLHYNIKGKHTLRTGERAQRLLVTEEKLDASFQYFAYPRLDPTAYLTGAITNTTNYHLLAGECLTYVGGEFTGRTYLPGLAPGESDTVSFGPDERIRVERTLLTDLKSARGVFKKSVRIELKWRIRVENYIGGPVSLLLYEAIPRPKHKDIKIKDINIQPRPDGQDGDKKLVFWKITLQPLGTWEANVSYAVEYPKDKRIWGLF